MSSGANVTSIGVYRQCKALGRSDLPFLSKHYTDATDVDYRNVKAPNVEG